jgi:omega-6 fatty acid desaturase (delta-12 desaturase)
MFELTNDIRTTDIVKSLPLECFHQCSWKAWTLALINVAILVLSYCALAILPWFFFPLLWIIAGTALTGFFVLGHDCGHYSFAKRRWVNELAGHLFLLPSLYPFYVFTIEHNRHHAHTTKLGRPGWKQVDDILDGKVDPYWHPLRTEVYDSLKPKIR